jgi:hypothetical protein
MVNMGSDVEVDRKPDIEVLKRSPPVLSVDDSRMKEGRIAEEVARLRCLGCSERVQSKGEIERNWWFEAKLHPALDVVSWGVLAVEDGLQLDDAGLKVSAPRLQRVPWPGFGVKRSPAAAGNTAVETGAVGAVARS